MVQCAASGTGRHLEGMGRRLGIGDPAAVGRREAERRLREPGQGLHSGGVSMLSLERRGG